MKEILLAIMLLIGATPPVGDPAELLGQQLQICPSGSPILLNAYGKDPQHVKLLEYMTLDETIFASLSYDPKQAEAPLVEAWTRDAKGRVKHFTGKTKEEILEKLMANGSPCTLADAIYLERKSI